MASRCDDLHQRTVQTTAGQCAKLPERRVRGKLFDTGDPGEPRADVLCPGVEGRHLIQWTHYRETTSDGLVDWPLMFAAAGWALTPASERGVLLHREMCPRCPP